MRRVLKISSFVAGVALLSGCAQHNQALYNYEDYSDNYYASKKNMTPDSSLALQQSIEKAIENADDSTSKRVPPGMYANLGYIYLKSGKSKEAIDNFVKEKTLYPESAHFMDRMIHKIEEMEAKSK
jgi:hypothetical protein